MFTLKNIPFSLNRKLKHFPTIIFMLLIGSMPRLGIATMTDNQIKKYFPNIVATFLMTICQIPNNRNLLINFIDPRIVVGVKIATLCAASKLSAGRDQPASFDRNAKNHERYSGIRFKLN